MIRIIRIFRGNYRLSVSRYFAYKCGNTGKLSNIRLITAGQYRIGGGSLSGGPISGASSMMIKKVDLIELYFNSSTRTENDLVYELIFDNVPMCDNEEAYFYNEDVTWRIEILNENYVLIKDNGKPIPGGSYPDYSKDYWKNAPTLVADEVQDDPDVYKLICTPANMQSDGIALYMAAGAGDPVLVETKPIAASIEFDAPIAELEAGTYTFTAVPVKGTASGIASAGVELVIPEPEPEPEPEPDPEPNP